MAVRDGAAKKIFEDGENFHTMCASLHPFYMVGLDVYVPFKTNSSTTYVTQWNDTPLLVTACRRQPPARQRQGDTSFWGFHG